ncbi:MAG: DEAD/DEAH box helicase [Bulleidia sp.]
MEILNTQLQEAMARLHNSTYTDVQKQVIPLMNAEKDVFVQAPAGSGKTLAYVLPALNRLSLQGKGKHVPHVLILCPTRELCIQVSQVIRAILFHIEGYRTQVLTGGVDMKVQIRSFSKGADIVVGTPARVLDHIRRHTLKPQHIETLILDEADEMMNMGFSDSVLQIISFLKDHQTVVCSATYPKHLVPFVQSLLHDSETVIITKEQVLPQKRTVHLISVKDNRKLDTLHAVLKQHGTPAIVFTSRKATADFVSQNLSGSASIHSDMDFRKRKQIMQEFRNGTIRVLCATAVAARGIDIPSVHTVVLYDLPDTKEELIHRCARTGRAGQAGDAWLLCNEKEKRKYDWKAIFPDIRYEKL